MTWYSENIDRIVVVSMHNFPSFWLSVLQHLHMHRAVFHLVKRKETTKSDLLFMKYLAYKCRIGKIILHDIANTRKKVGGSE